MKKTLSRQSLWQSCLISVSLLMFPLITNAQNIVWQMPSFLNPEITTIEGLLLALLNVFIIIATPIIVLFIIYAGFLYVTAKGNAEQIQQATRAIMYAIIGGILVIGALVLAGIIENIIASFEA
jgi:hypothetical protein